MGETEGEAVAADSRGSEEPEAAPAQDTLQVPAQKKRKLKSPTPGSLRGRSATPIRGRSQTPFTLYMTRRSATPSTWRSITPFLKREEKEKTPFELGRDLKTLLTCNTAVFDRALVMDISEPLEAQKPVRYITSDLSVIDRAAVMDVSNVEVIYVVEEYEEYEEEEEEVIEEVVKPKKKSKGGKKARTPRKSIDKDGSPGRGDSQENDMGEYQDDREESVDLDDQEEPTKKGKKKAAPKKKEKKEKSPSPKLSLKLEMGGGQKASKKMFEDKNQSSGPAPKPPPKKSKLALQMEEQAKAAAKAAEEEAARQAAKKPVETFEERQKRLKAEQEELEREEAERRAQEEAEAAEAAEEAGEEEDEGDNEEGTEFDEASSRYDESRYDDESKYDEDEEMDEVGELPAETRRSSDASEGFTRPDPDDEERWKKIAEEEGEEFMQQMRKYSLAVRKSEKQRDAEWQRLRDQRRLPRFIVFLSDRTVEAGKNVRLSCAVGGPELSVKWFKDGRQLERDNTHRIINNNNILALDIINTTILDSGEYTCVIANMNDEVTSSCYVTIYEVFKDQPAPPSFRLIREYYHLRDDELAIEVHVHGVPRPVVTWWNGAFEIKPNVKFTKLEEAHGVYKLLIYKPNSKDSGLYTCRAINSSGEAQVSHAVEVAKNRHYHVHGIFHARDRIQRDKEQKAKIAMEDALKSKGESDKKRAEAAPRAARASPEPLVPTKQKLKFATQLRDRMAMEGSTIKLVVTVIGPDPACRWMKDDKWVVYGDKVKNRTEGDKAIIELKDVTAENSGVYKCVAKNEFSEIETSCYFKVYSAQTEGDEHEPIFALPLRDVYHSSQNDLILDTKIRGNPRPVITWIKDQLPVVLDDRIVQIEHLDGICELIINKPTTNDSGNYTCVAQNKLGSQQTSHSVVVDVNQGSRRSSVLSGAMSDSDAGSRRGGAGAGGDKAGRPPKTKKKEEEGDASYERRSRLPDISPKQQLYFTTFLSNRYVAVGAKVKLQAVVDGPNPAMKWLKDDQNLTFGPRMRNMSREGLACLEFLNCQPEDTGTYTLVAQNEHCKISETCQLHVYSPNVSDDVEPVFTRPIKDTYHLNSNELILETSIRGVPLPQVQWLKDNIDIENGGRFHIFQHVDGNCELVIDSPSDKDSGKYIVRAESSAGKAECRHNVLFRGKEHHIADNIHGVFHADKSLLKPKHIEEERPKMEVVEKGEPSESEGDDGSKGKKRVRKPKKEDEETEATSASAYATDTGSETGSLKKREKVIGIHFATAVRDRVVAEGTKIKISCFLEAKEPQVKWFKNDEQIQNSQKIKGRYVEGLCTLEIASAELADSGEYKCWARDETGEASTYCKLEVYSDPGTGDVPPTFTRNIKDTYHGKINEVQLDCHVRGLPTPTITWVKDGVTIEPSDKYQQVEHDDGTLELFIMDPTQADSGKYVCQAENREGKAEIVHMVTVQPRRRRPVSPTRDRPPALPPTEETEEEKENKRKKKQDEEEGGGRRREAAPPPDLKKRVYFRNFLSNRTVKEGSNVKWMVTIDGPDPTARWFHNDNPIAFGPTSKLSMQDGIAWLNLIGVTEASSGEYTLKVKGSENEIVSTCTLFVYSLGKEELVAPTFAAGIKDAYHSHENHITLECKVSGNPKPNVYWQKDNTLLSEEGDKYKYIDMEDGIKQLVIRNPSKEDTALYTCYAESESGQMKISKFVDISDYIKKITERRASKLNQEQLEEVQIAHTKNNLDDSDRQEQKLRSRDIKFKLNVGTPMKPMTIASGTKAQLICYVAGLIEDVYWLRGNERVTKDSRHKIYSINGALSLEIYDVRPDDSGQYKCVVRNNRNSTESVCDLTVYDSTSTELPSSFSSAVTATFDAARCEIILSCFVRGRPSVTWIRDDHTISNNRYRTTEGVGGVHKLIIRNPIPSDCGTFSCFAETNDRIESIIKVIKIVDLKNLMTAAVAETQTNGFVNASEDTDNHISEDLKNAKNDISQRSAVGRSLNVTTQRKPLFSTLLFDRTITECSNVRLSCSVVYDGCTNIEWLRDNQPLPSDNRYQTVFHNGEAILEIFATQESDSGQYTCRATNDFGESLTQSQLRVYKHYKDAPQPATFVQSIKDSYSINENELLLECRVRGKPRPEIQWMKGTDMLMPGEKYVQIDQPDGYSKLIVCNPTEKDSGLYACIARNEVAENKITHQVDFKGRERFAMEKTIGFFHRDPNKPHFVTPLGNQTVCNGGTIAISAEFMQTNTPIEVQWFRDRQSLAGQPNVKTFYERSVYTLAIMDAQPENEGTYICRAQNAFGRIESQAHVDVAVGVSKEERPPLFLSRPETEMKIAVGDPFSLSFRIAGDPKPKLTFMKGTKDITKSDRVSKEVSDDYTRFTVQKAQISDSGTYFVVARNNNGTDRIFVTVEVMPRARSETPSAPRWGLALESYPDVSYFKDPPAAISTEPLLVDSGPTHISLSWGKPASTGNSAPVIAYRVDAWVVGHDGGAVWKELGLTPINSFDAFNLKPNVEYHFRVTPKNRYGWGPSVQTSAPLQVGGVECLPEFTVILPGQVKALLNKEFILEAVVRGTPRPDIVWYKDGLRISSNVESERIKTRKIGSTCSLTIKQVTEIDAGRYTCEATNSRGRVSTFARLQVVSDPKLYEADNRLKEILRQDNISAIGDTLPIFTMRLRDRRVQVTYPVRLTCQVVGHPKPEITWLKDDELLQSSRRCLVTEEHQFYTLELASAQLNDSGIYTCTAKNELGSVSCHCSLVVDKGIRAYISPEFYMPLDPLYIVQEGQELRLTAKVEAYPAVGVSWHRNGVKLRPSRRLACSLDANGLVQLLISETNIRDAGIYTCVASNAVGKQESMCRVCIEPLEENGHIHIQTTRTVPAIWTNDLPYSKEPLFVVKPRSSEACEGDTVIIFCEVVGDPKPDVVWLRDFLKPEYYRDAPHFRRIGEGPEYRLEIPYAKLDFTGTYSVIATNCHGETKAVISLQIYAKDIFKQNSMEKGSIRHGNVETLPHFIRHLRNLRCCDGDAITLEAHVEGLPEPVIIWEKDGRVLPSGKDFEMTYDGIKATLSIPRIYPEDEGEYTCIAKNNIGRTLSSACIIVDVPEEKENMLNRQLTRPTGLLSATSTPLSTPRSTPIRSISPTRHLSYRNSIIDISEPRSRSSSSRCLVDGRQAIAAPKFLAIPNSRVVEEGDSVRFQCAIAGHPVPWATWDKDGIIVTPATRIAVKEMNDLRYLEIEEVSYEDAGLYRITLENDYGRIEATARLDVISSSRFSKSPSARSVRASSSKRNGFLHRRIMGPSTAIGGRMALAAGFRGSSVPSCKFYHNGLEMELNERIHIDLLQEQAFLFVNNVTKEDEGVYTCVIEGHEHEPIVTSTVVTFLPEDQSHQPPQTICNIVQPLPNEIEYREGDTIDLCFEIKCNMPYTYMWRRNGELIRESDDFNYIDHGNGILCLRIHDAFDLDSGCYNCLVTTVDGFQCSTFTNLNIERNSEIIDDNGVAVMKSPLPAVAECGVKSTFWARVFPTDAQAIWYVCGRMVVANLNVDDDSCEYTLESSSTDGLRILHINNVTLAHSGEVQLVVTHPGKPQSSLKSYTTLAVIPRATATTTTTTLTTETTNLFESTKTHTDLKTTDLINNYPKHKERAQLPAYILEGPGDCTALIGGCVRLSVIFEGTPKPQVRWFKASRPIIETSNIIINTSSRKSILQISDIVTDDSGKYTVEVMNEFGTDLAVASVAVEGPPEPPSGKPSISQGPDRVSIAWCGPPYDGGCMLTGFIIEMQELLSVSANEDEANWLEIASVVDSLAYTVKDLKPLCFYRFRVRAENVHGRSEPGLPSDRVHISEENEDSTEDFQKPISIKAGGEFKERFEILEELGKGRFGIVYKVQEKEEPKRICAAKVIKCIKSRDRVKVQDEISIMKSLKHPKLLQLAASFESSREIVMVMEYITGGELFERVVADDFTLTERDCILFVRQVCEGVAYMHGQSIVHLDLKPENIMCKTRTCHKIKIIDFGLAQRLNTNSPVRVLFGTPEFIPPEIISYEPIGFQSDMWSVGVICYVLLSGLSPFMGDSDVETFSNITRADYDFDDDAFDCVSQPAKDFISNLLVHRKEDRWTANQCLESPWLKQGHHDENLGNKKICTDKLKKFIIRRKWQKTGNAIRALGRMATLSASRRNSVASNVGSVPNSPRPSISGTSIFNPNVSVHMGSLHEEDDDFSIELPNTEMKRKNAKVLNKSQCSERSDSGYSECSNCSASTSVQCQCANNKDSVDHIANEELSLSVPHDLLKLKLEQIAHQADSNIEEVKLELVVPNERRCPQLDDNQNELKTLKIVSAEEKSIQVVEELDVLNKELTPSSTSTIMRSDFTNTIQMRKKSLENSLQKDKQLKTTSKSILFEKPGKVSMLKNKFSCMQQSQVSNMKTTSSSSFAKSKDCMDVLKLKRKVVAEACPNKTAGSSLTSSSSSLHTPYSTSLPSSPIPARKTNTCTTFRLSDRVREVTDRLAERQTVCTEARRTQKSPSPNRKRILSP